MKAGYACAIVGASLLAIGLAIAALLPRVEPVVDLDGAVRAEANSRAAAGAGEQPQAGADPATRTTAVAAGASGVVEPDPEVLTLDLRVEWPDGRAAADAELWFLPPRTREQADGDREEFERVADDESVVRARGQSAPLDVDGRARVRACAEGALFARRGEHFVGVSLRDVDADVPLRLVLQRDVLLQVQVIDQQGAPRAGVSLVITVSFVLRSDGDQDTDYVELPPTDARGFTRSAHLQQQLPMPAVEVLDWSCKLVDRHRVSAMPERVLTADELWRGAPIRCVVASAGVVDVTVVDEDGKRLSEEVQLVDVVTQTRFRPADLGAEACRFLDVPLGKRWRIEVWRGGDVWHQLEIAGPSAVAEVLAVRVVVPFRRVGLGFLVVCEDGEVARGAVATVLGTIEGGVRTGSSLGSTPSAVQVGDACCCALWLGRGERLAQAFVRLRHPSIPSVVEVPLASDIVGDADLGRFVLPLRRACEELLRVRVRLAGAVVTRTASLNLDAGMNGSWNSNVYESTLDGDYRVLRGLRPLGGLRLVCGHEGARLGVREVAVGETVDVDLEAAAELVVPLRLRHVPESLFEAIVHFEGGVARGLLFDDRLVWSELPLGAHTLTLHVDGREVLRRELPSLPVGRTVWPSWDAPIDIDRMARVVRLRVRDQTGVAIEYWSRFLVGRGATTLPAEWQSSRQPAWLMVDEVARDLVVWGQERVPVRLPQPDQDLEVVLQPTTKVVMREAAGTDVAFALAVTRPGLDDPLLHAVLESLADRSERYQLARGSSEEFDLAPGTELLLTVKRGDAPAREQKVVVGTTSPQEVLLR